LAEDNGGPAQVVPDQRPGDRRDIITLWVARMVMMGLYNMKADPVPPRRDQPTDPRRQGRADEQIQRATAWTRWTSSRPTAPTPCASRSPHGHRDAGRADAVKKLPSGKNTVEKFDLGRNFCNKLWNAARFVALDDRS
jgi:valyl-tRNA synthetase